MSNSSNPTKQSNSIVENDKREEDGDQAINKDDIGDGGGGTDDDGCGGGEKGDGRNNDSGIKEGGDEVDDDGSGSRKKDDIGGTGGGGRADDNNDEKEPYAAVDRLFIEIYNEVTENMRQNKVTREAVILVGEVRRAFLRLRPKLTGEYYKCTKGKKKRNYSDEVKTDSLARRDKRQRIKDLWNEVKDLGIYALSEKERKLVNQYKYDKEVENEAPG